MLADFQGSQESEIEFALAGMKKKVEEGEREVDVWRGKAEHAEKKEYIKWKRVYLTQRSFAGSLTRHLPRVAN